jgi:hypothetical protein
VTYQALVSKENFVQRSAGHENFFKKNSLATMQTLPVLVAVFLSTSNIFPHDRGQPTVTPIGPAIFRNASYLQMESIATTTLPLQS